MLSIELVIAAIAVAFFAGVAIGWLVGVRRRPEHRDAIAELKARLERETDRRADYESEVRAHFETTADLLGQLTADYRSVYEHMSRGAENLCDGEVALPLASVSVQAPNVIPDALVDAQQPLDYAPRKNPDEQGQLSEDFGIEKAPPSTRPEPDEAQG